MSLPPDIKIPGPNLGETLGMAAGTGLKGLLSNFLEERKQKKAQEKKQKQIQSFLASPEAKSLSDVEKSVFTGLGKGIYGETLAGKLFEELRKEKQDQDFFNMMKGVSGEQNIDTQQPDENIPSETAQKKTGLNKQQLMMLSAHPNPRYSKFAETQLADIREKERNEYNAIRDETARKQWAHTQTSKFGEQISDSSERAKELIDATNQIEEALAKGTTGKKARNLAVAYLTKRQSPFASLFITPDMQKILSGAKVLLGGGLKEIVGARPTEREFFWINTILPDILKDLATNEESIRYFKYIAKYNLKRQEVYDEIINENEGYRPLNIQAEVNKRLKPDLDKLIDEGYKISEAAKNAVEKEQVGPTALKKVKQGTTLTKETAQNILNKAGGDKSKARKLAKQLGYEF